MKNQIELLCSSLVQGWIRETTQVDLSLSQPLLRFRHSLLDQAKQSRDGNLGRMPLPAHSEDPEVTHVLTRFASYVDRLAEEHALPRIFE